MAQLAELAGVSEAEIGRMVDLGVLVAREGAAPFLTIDLRKVRLALACERAGLPMDGIAAAIRAGRLSFAFLEASPYHRWAVPSDRTYRQVSEETGVPLDVLRETLESMGFAWTSPDEPMREDELEVDPGPPDGDLHRHPRPSGGWPGSAGPTPRACAWPRWSRPRSSRPASRVRRWTPGSASARSWSWPPSSPPPSCPWSTGP